ncbi:MAG TPA: peptidoglycan DD-metalloendopeptidase family protein [Pseudonocardiaceae bacterium]
MATTAGFVGVLAGVLCGLLLGSVLPGAVLVVMGVLGFLLLTVGTALNFLPGAPRVAPRVIAPPVRGRWSALNSPANKVPSHGTHGYGQTFAVDLIFEPADDSRPRFGRGPGFRPPADYPGFGRPLLAPDDGTVVSARDGARDHLSRSSWAAFGYLMLEGVVRELFGTRFMLGNHVVLRLDDGVYALLAHLRHGSVAAAPGQRVARGQEIGQCGNSGNSSEPHVHVQLMDSPRPFLAAGLPFLLEGAPALPRNEQAVTIGGEAS